MSWIKSLEEEGKKPWIQQFCCNVLKNGPVPKHIAFIMDGNRRYASKHSMERTQGHVSGFDKLAHTLDWCWDLGVTEVTVYAFSIENFKRSKDEVEGLMELARQKLAKLLQEKEMIMKHGVCVKMLGDVDMLPKDIQELVSEAVIMSKDNTRATFNVCFAYTSRHEMCNAMKLMAEGVQLGMIEDSDIDEDLLEKCLYSKGSRDPDVLIRTSGEVRLSDFLLWQSSFSLLSFTKVLWPEFNVWDLYAAILYYQQHFHILQRAKQEEKLRREKIRQDLDYQSVLKRLAEMKTEQPTDYSGLKDMISTHKEERMKRVQNFISFMKVKEEKHLLSLVPTHSQLTIPPSSYVCV